MTTGLNYSFTTVFIDVGYCGSIASNLLPHCLL